MKTLNYCILIELSRRTIAFSYSRDDGKNQFVPYGDELVKPLAICCSGNELRIGKFAADEARAGQPGAYENIFEAIKRPSSFTYRGTEYPLNKLLLFGIEQCLREFFDSILYGTEGQLEQNTSKVPICLLMSSELTDNEQAYVVSLLKNAGYSNTVSIDYNTKVLEYVRDSLGKNIEMSVFVSTVGNDLFVECMDARHPKRNFDISAKGAGKDPMLDQVVRLIWQEIAYGGNAINLVFEDCLPELQNQAQRFLNSGDPMWQNAVTFNGHPYEYFISKSSISNSSHGNDNALDNLLFQLKSKGVEPTKSALVLLKSTAKNAYVRQAFSNLFPSVVVFDEQRHEEMLNSILADVKKQNYILADYSSNPFPASSESVQTILAEPSPRETTSSVGPQIDQKEFNREWRMVKATANGFLRTRKPDEAIATLEVFIKSYEQKGVDLSEVQLLMEDAQKLKRTYPGVKPAVVASVDRRPAPEASPRVAADEKILAREWRMVRAEAKGYVRENKVAQACDILERFIRNYEGMDLTEAQQMLNTLSSHKTNTGSKDISPATAKAVSSDKSDALSEGEKLMRELRFKEARDWFSEQKLTAKAADCTLLIKATRQLRAYKAEKQSVKNNHNLQLAKSYINDMNSWRVKYVLYGLDTTELDELIDYYKSIK